MQFFMSFICYYLMSFLMFVTYHEAWKPKEFKTEHITVETIGKLDTHPITNKIGWIYTETKVKKTWNIRRIPIGRNWMGLPKEFMFMSEKLKIQYLDKGVWKHSWEI